MNRKTIAAASLLAVVSSLGCRSGEPAAEHGSSTADGAAAAETGMPETAAAPPAMPSVGRSYRDVMRAFIKSKADEFLEQLAESGQGAEGAAGAARAIVELTGRVDWSGFAAYKKEPAAVVAIADDVARLAVEFQAQAERGDLAAIRTAADRLLTRCFDCHIKYKK